MAEAMARIAVFNVAQHKPTKMRMFVVMLLRGVLQSTSAAERGNGRRISEIARVNETTHHHRDFSVRFPSALPKIAHMNGIAHQQRHSRVEAPSAVLEVNRNASTYQKQLLEVSGPSALLDVIRVNGTTHLPRKLRTGNLSTSIELPQLNGTTRYQRQLRVGSTPVLLVVPGVPHESKSSQNSVATERSASSAFASLFSIAIATVMIVPLPFALLFAMALWYSRHAVANGKFQWTRARLLAFVSIIVYIGLLICADTLASRVAQTHHGSYPWNPALIVLIVEALKLVMSMGCHCASSWSVRGSAETRTLSPLVCFNTSLRILPVAMIYAGNNWLAFIVLAKVQLSDYVVWRNTNIFFNALLWTFILQRRLNWNKWIGVVYLFVGCCLNSLGANSLLRGSLGFPTLLILLLAFDSALAAVLNEAVLKKRPCSAIGVDGINILLYTQTFCFVLAGLIVQKLWSGLSIRQEMEVFCSNLDRSAAALIAIQALLGIVVSRVLLYADSMAKTLAGGVREVVQVVVAPLFVTSRLDWRSFPAVIWIALAVVMYTVPEDERDGTSLTLKGSEVQTPAACAGVPAALIVNEPQATPPTRVGGAKAVMTPKLP
eukprot:TRINITY_DN55308_c0_g1_i1.p1 TRINITY_DN55308_c0_g1~~TRINITY_DN55308_c0_g1_i1.p1  ORF type:complete len:620 (+),score=96.49 TRINITY_DN55308_c0_g1_i1:51-1862(+)